MSQRWREESDNHIRADARVAFDVCADGLDAAKLRIEEALKALVTVDGKDVRVPYWAVLKIIREIL